MSIVIIPVKEQAKGAFNGGEIIENKPLGFPQEGGQIRPYSNLFYWANAIAKTDSTIGLHPHQGFEIMSFVLEGTIRHYDTKLKEWRELKAGDVQIIRSGSGISHAEHMTEGSRMFQIWFDPNLNKTLAHEPTYDDYRSGDFEVEQKEGLRRTHYAGQDKTIYMESPGVAISRLEINGKAEMTLQQNKIYSLYILTGNPEVNDHQVSTDDFLKISGEEKLHLKGEGNIFMIESDNELNYATYAERMK